MMASHILLQTVFVPIAAAVLILFINSKKGYHAALITIVTLIYNTILLCLVYVKIVTKGSVLEEYVIGPFVSLNLLADGLSLPIALVVNIICVALAVYSMHYVDHRIKLIYPNCDEKTYTLYYKRFFFLYLFFPTGFMGVAFSTNLISMYVFLEILTIIPL